MVQAVWSTAHGHPLRMTSLHGDQISRLAAHVDPILVLFAPLWWLWPSPHLLLAVQAVVIALGAVPVFLLARKHLASPRAALGFALAYLLYPATGWLTLNEFHPVALATPSPALRLLVPRRRPPAPVRAVRARRVGLQGGDRARRRRLRHLVRRRAQELGGRLGDRTRRLCVGRGRDRRRDPALQRRRRVRLLRPLQRGGRIRGRDPQDGLHSSTANRRGGIERPRPPLPARSRRAAAALCLLAPLVLVAALPELAINLLSSTTTQTSIHFHYTAGLIPPLMIGAIFGAKRLSRWTFPVAAGDRPRGARRELPARADPRLAPRPGRTNVPGDRGARDRSRPHRAARAAAHSGRRRRQRDQHARRTSVRAPPRAQLPVPRGFEVDRSRRDATGLRGSLRADSHRDATGRSTTKPGVAARVRGGRDPRLPAQACVA